MTTLRFLFMILALVAFSAQPALALKSQKPPSHAVAPPHHVAEAPSSSEYSLPPEPYPGFDAFVDTCLHKLTSECGNEIFDSILINNSVTDKCCLQLVAMGPRCHEAIFEAILASVPDLKEDRTQIMKKNVETWEQCVLITNIEASSPVPTIE